MAVSYKSQTFRSSPYVLPLDLGLFSNVMSIKQKKFDDNALKFQSEIDQMGLLDVMKSEDKDYLNQKINNITTTVNNLGGVDFSDQNVFGQIEGLGSDVYGDNKILNAISSTKSIRGLVASYDKYKNDPKLSKLYSEVNEAFDMQNVNSYLTDKEVGSKYSGPTQATPYTAYRDNHIKLFEKMKADLVETLDDKGLFILKGSSERITPERIMTMAAELLTPQERAQMQRDGWYSYRGAKPEDLVKKGLEQFSYKKQEAEAILKQYEAMADAAVSDPQARKQYNILIDNQKKVVDQLTEAEKQVPDNIVSKFKENPNQLYGELYSADYMRGLGNRFSVNRTKRDFIPNTAEMFRQKMIQADNQFSQTLGFKEKELGVRISENEEKNTIELLKIGKYRHIDPQTGNVEYLDLPGWKNGQEHLITDTPNIENPSDLKVKESTLLDMNTEKKIENDKTYQDFIGNIVALHPELGIEVPSNIGKGTTRMLKGQSTIEGFNNEPGFQVEDLKLFQQTVDKEGNPVYANVKEVSRYGRENNLTPNQLQFLANQWKNYEAIALGKGATNPDLVDGFENTVRKVQLNNIVINANNKKLADVREQVFKEMNLPPEILKELNNMPYVINPTDQYGRENRDNNIIANMQRWFLNLGNNAIPVIKAIEKEVKNRIGKKLEVLSTRDVYGVRTLSEKEALYPELAKLSKIEIINNKGEPYGDSPKLNFKGISPDAIVPISIGRTSDGTGRNFIINEITVGSGDKKQTVQYKTYIDDANAAKFGLNRDPYESINYAVSVNGRASDILIYGNKNLAIYADVVAYSNDLNDNSTFVQAKVYDLDANGQKTSRYTTIKIPATEGRIASESFKLAEQAIKQAAKAGLTHEQFVEYLRNYKNR